jgi:hypothetical protein
MCCGVLNCRIIKDLPFGEVTFRDRNFSSFLRRVNFCRLLNVCSRFDVGFSRNYFWISSFRFELLPTFGLFDKIFEASQILSISNSKFVAISFQTFHEPVKILGKIQVIGLNDKLAKPRAVVIKVFAGTLYSRNE